MKERSMPGNYVRFGLALIFLHLTPGNITAAWKYQGCDDVSGANFRVVPIVTKSEHPPLHEPLKMAFLQDDKGNVNIFFIQKRGQIKYFDAASKTVIEVGKLTPSIAGTKDEDGLTGIALDPGFKTNGYIYLYYSFNDAFRLSRFQVQNNKMDMGSEKIILKIPSGRNRWHTSGAMNFDDYGDLWINVGDNEACEMGPANTADLRGKILRIRVKPDGSYEIPQGNLWEFAAERFEKSGQPGIAEKYRDPKQVKREIYAMGMRNPYTMGLDPVRRWMGYGDCGPDFCLTCNSEEHSFVTEPGFFGWPYWTGVDFLPSDIPFRYDEPQERFWGNKDPAKPVNLNSSAMGVDELLPHTPALHAYVKNCAMSGPIARYFPASKAAYKLPPHFNRIWFIADFNNFWVDAIQLSEDGKRVLKQERMWDEYNLATKWGKMLDFQQGPDGALYMLSYTCSAWYTSNKCTGIWRIEYTGKNCNAPNFKMEKVGCTDKNFQEYDAAATHNDARLCKTPGSGIQISGPRGGVVINNVEISITVPGEHSIRIFDASGKSFNKITGSGKTTHSLPHLPKKGLYIVRAETVQGIFSKRILNF